MLRHCNTTSNKTTKGIYSIHRDAVNTLCRAVLYFPAVLQFHGTRLHATSPMPTGNVRPSLSRLSWNSRSSAAARADTHRTSPNTAPFGARRILTKMVTTQQSTRRSIIPNCNPIRQEIRELGVEIHLYPNGSKTVNGTTFHTTHASQTTFSHELLLKFMKISEMIQSLILGHRRTYGRTDGRTEVVSTQGFFFTLQKSLRIKLT
jgi:hypothetical protein